MSIDINTVRKVARLARIRTTDAEAEVLSGELSKILKMIEQLSEVNTDGVEPLVHAIEVHNIFRTDEPAPSLPVEAALANAHFVSGSTGTG